MIVLTAKITLANGEVININQNNILSIDGSISARGDTKQPSYGIISNSGSLSFRDTDFKVLEYANNLLLVEGLTTEIFVKNTLTQKTEKVGEYITKKWNYNNENFVVDVSFGDNLEEMQDVEVEGISYDPRKPYKNFMNMADFYKLLCSKTPSKYRFISFESLSTRIKNILENTIINYDFLFSGNLWRQWTKLCEVCGLYIYKNEDGITTCQYSLGA